MQTIGEYEFSREILDNFRRLRTSLPYFCLMRRMLLFLISIAVARFAVAFAS
jgi:hypothetical protein